MRSCNRGHASVPLSGEMVTMKEIINKSQERRRKHKREINVVVRTEDVSQRLVEDGRRIYNKRVQLVHPVLGPLDQFMTGRQFTQVGQAAKEIKNGQAAVSREGVTLVHDGKNTINVALMNRYCIMGHE